MSDDRRDFFKKAAGAAVTLASIEAVLEATGRTPTADAAIGPDNRAFAASRFALELEGVVAGFLRSTDGGDVSADVVVEQPEPGACFARKHLANVKYGDITISCGTGMNAAFYAWVQGFFGCEAGRRNGAILSADSKFTERARRSFSDALIAEIGFPALDGSSKDAAFMTVTIVPEHTERQKGSGKTLTACGASKSQKKWLASNFRLTIDGLDCTRVNRIDALTFKQGVAPDQTGDERSRVPGRTEFPNLVVTLAESHAQSFFDWHEDFVIKGNNSSEGEKNGKLEYLTPNLSEALFTLDFHNLGIFKLAPEKAETNDDQISRVTAEMYCEQITFSFGKVGC